LREDRRRGSGGPRPRRHAAPAARAASVAGGRVPRRRGLGEPERAPRRGLRAQPPGRLADRSCRPAGLPRDRPAQRAAMTLPRLTVITPSLNQAQYLERALRSVLDQGYPDLEYIVMDGGSTDGSVDILHRYDDRLAYWVSEPDQGQSWAINRAIERSTGDVVAYINSD